MKKLLLGLKDYEKHMTDEGHQLQVGLIENGYEVWGKGFENDCTDVAEIIERTHPDIVVVIDKREWDATMPGAFDKSAAFTNIDALRNRSDICKITICKDAASLYKYQQAWSVELGADGYICYYSHQSVLDKADWIAPWQFIRTRHSVDAARVPKIVGNRGGTLVSGARSSYVYPLRETCIRWSDYLGVNVRNHPGYHNCGSCTPHFLDALVTWKVHICCASRYGFSLRKIIESVACGCTVITDLPAHDKLPEIDDALIRVETGILPDELRRIIRKAEREWNLQTAREWSEKCLAYYDYHVMGKRLSDRLDLFYEAWKQRQTAC